MILINLLPHREAVRKRKREAFFVSLGISALIGGLIAGAAFGWYRTQISAQNDKNALLQTEIKKLEGQIKEIANLQTEIAALKARQQAVENLQSDRNLPVNLMNDLVKNLPDGVFINRLTQRDGSTIDFGGVAESTDRISELLRNINNSEWISKPELIEINYGPFTLSPRDIRRVSNFSMRAAIRKPTDLVKASVAASAPPKANEATLDSSNPAPRPVRK